MTWTKLSDDFGDDCARVELTDAAFRTHVEGLLWTMRRETDGHLDRIDVRRFAETEEPGAAVAELVAVGFWRATATGWDVVHHLDHQPESDVIAARRAAAAERQRNKRRKAAGVDAHASSEVSRRDAPRDGVSDDRGDDTRDPGRGGAGLDGSGSTEGKYYGTGGVDDEGYLDDVSAGLDMQEPPDVEPLLDEDELEPEWSHVVQPGTGSRQGRAVA